MKDVITEPLDFNLNILLTKHQTNRLRLFSGANDTDAVVFIQETTDILIKMFQSVEPKSTDQSSNISEYVEKFHKRFLTIIMDSRIQIALFSIINVSISFEIFQINTKILFI